jgi:hypothetical protein
MQYNVGARLRFCCAGFRGFGRRRGNGQFRRTKMQHVCRLWFTRRAKIGEETLRAKFVDQMHMNKMRNESEA